LTGKSAHGSVRVTLPSLLLVAPGGRQVRLYNPATVIGRATECDVVIKASEISKRHCRILLAPDHVTVEDLGSSNGTFVNGKQIDRARLHDGDQLDLGGHVFEVRLQKPTSK
jgi:pSer/pThr/pTyr-binding forkhead associated (FHA) protein